MGHVVLEHVPESDQYRVLYCHDSFLGSTARFESVVERLIVAVLRAGRGPCDLLERRAQPGRSLAGRGRLALARALVVARAQTCPGCEVRSGGKHGHVNARLGEDRLRGACCQPGDGLDERRGLGQRHHGLVDACIERGDVGVERVDQGQVLLQEEGVMGSEVTHQGLAERSPLLAEQALGELGEEGRIGDARTQRVQNGAAGLAHEIGHDATELELGQLQRLLDAIDVVASLADQRLAQAGQITEIPHRTGWHKTAPQQAAFE